MSSLIPDTKTKFDPRNPSNYALTIMKRFLIACCAALPTLALGNSACDIPKNDFDGLYCLNKIYLEADAELNSNYKKLIPKLDVSGAAALKKGQLAWIDERNRLCSRKEGSAFFVDLACATRTTIQRSQFLQDRHRECVSSGCQNSKL